MSKYQLPLNSYAGDGLCHAAPRGSFNHECGKPAEFIGTKDSAFRTGFCKSCMDRGIETAAYRFEAIKTRSVDGPWALIETR